MAGSPQAQTEIAELHAIAGRATPDMMAAAKHDSDDERPDLFNDPIRRFLKEVASV